MCCPRLIPMMLLLVLAIAPSHAEPYTRSETGQPLIMNYWTHLQSLLEENEHQRETKTMRPGGPVIRRINYPFNAIMHLKPPHLLRAAREGIDFARTEGWGLAPEAAAMQAYRNVGVALEYFPLLALAKEDFMPILYAMGKREEDPILRIFLLNHVMPGLEAPSLFGRYMQEQFQELDIVEARPYLLEPATFPLEEPAVQEAAMRALYTYDMHWFTEKLAGMPEMEAYARQVEAAPGPALLLHEEAPRPTGDLGAYMSELLRSIGLAALYMADIAAPASTRPESLQAVAREHVGLILDNFPIPQAAQVRARLAGREPRPAEEEVTAEEAVADEEPDAQLPEAAAAPSPTEREGVAP